MYKFKNFIDLNSYEIYEVFTMRNKLYVREQMKNSSNISYQEHTNFIRSLQHNKLSAYFLVQREIKNKSIKSIGVYSLTSIDIEGAEGGFYISEYAINNNLLIEFVYYSLKFMFEHFHINKIYGYMLESNIKALKVNNFFEFDVTDTKIIEGRKYIHSELSRNKWLNSVFVRSDIINLLQFTANQYHHEK